MQTPSTLTRQINDIQLQAEKLISGNPTDEEFEQFNSYNEELKHFLLTNVESQEIHNLVHSIPNILDVQIEKKSMTIGVLLIAILTLGISALYISIIIGMRTNKLIQNNIQTARGKYASIEFLMKS